MGNGWGAGLVWGGLGGGTMWGLGGNLAKFMQMCLTPGSRQQLYPFTLERIFQENVQIFTTNIFDSIHIREANFQMV